MYQKVWDKNTLEGIKKELIKSKNRSSDSTNIIKAIEQINAIIIGLDSTEDYIKGYYDLVQITKTINRYKHHFDDMLCLEGRISQYRDKIIELGPKFKNDHHLSLNDHLELTYDFYRQLDKNIFELFLQIFKEYKTNLNFLKYNYDEFLGEIYTIDGINKCYINIFDTKNINTLLSFVHEYGHGCAFLYNPERFSDQAKDIYKEIESFFLEFVAEDYFENVLSSYSFIDTRLDKFNIIYDLSDNTIEMSIICDEFKKAHFHKREKIREIASKLDVDRNLLKDLLEIDYEDAFTYCISFIVAINLYKLYLKDKEFAMYELKKIIASKKEDNNYKYFKEKGYYNQNNYEQLLKHTIKRKKDIL